MFGKKDKKTVVKNGKPDEPVKLAGRFENTRLRQITEIANRVVGGDPITPEDILGTMTYTWAYLDTAYLMAAMELFSTNGFLARIGVPGHGAFSQILGEYVLEMGESSEIAAYANKYIIGSGYEPRDDCFYGTNVQLPENFNTYDSSYCKLIKHFTLEGDFSRTESDIPMTSSVISGT